MSSFTADWPAATTIQNAQSLTNTSTLNSDVDLDGNGWFAADFQVKFDISSGSPAGNLEIRVYGSVDAGSTVDTEESMLINIPFTGTGIKNKSFALRGPWKRVACKNSTGVTGTLTTKVQGLKGASA